MIIDAHHHYWQLDRGDYPWPNSSVSPIFRDFLPDDLIPILETEDISKTILVQATATVAETAFLLSLANAHEHIAGVVGWVDLSSESAFEDIDRLSAHPKFKGIRPMLQDIPDVSWILKPQALKILDYTASKGLVMDALIQPRHLTAIAQLQKELPDLPMVIDHLAKPDMVSCKAPDYWWVDGMARLAENPSTHCKLSGMVTEIGPEWCESDLLPFVEHVLTCFGPDRIMWGSDWPVLNLATNYGTWIATARAMLQGQKTEDVQNILGGNAKRFYGLSL